MPRRIAKTATPIQAPACVAPLRAIEPTPVQARQGRRPAQSDGPIADVSAVEVGSETLLDRTRDPIANRVRELGGGNRDLVVPKLSVRPFGLLWLLITLLIFLVLRIYDSQSRIELAYDETISYLAATGTQCIYADLKAQGLFDRWTAAGEFSALRMPPRELDFAKVLDGLVKADIHPPLYFFALHVWQWMFGPEVSTLRILNVLVSAASIAAMAWLSARVFGRNRWALVSIGLFAFSPIMIAPFQTHVRQYELLQLFVVLTAICWSYLLTADRRRTLLCAPLLVVVQVGGLLTHTQFAVVILASLAASLVVPGLRRARFLLLFALALVSAVCFVALHPGIFEQLARQQQQAQHFKPLDLFLRVYLSYSSILDILGLRHVSRTLISAILFVPVLILFVSLLVRGIRAAGAAGRLTTVQRFASLTALICVLTYFLLYFSYVTPTYAMGGRYFLLFWPLLSVALTLSVMTLAIRWRRAIVAICAGTLLFGNAVHLKDGIPLYARLAKKARAIAAADRIWANTDERGILPEIILKMRGDATIYVDSGETDLAAFRTLLTSHPGIDLFALSATFKEAREPVEAARREILDRLGPPGSEYWNGTTLVYDYTGI